jgi:hypothetical protein
MGADAAGLPPKGDQANAVLTGTLTGIGPGDCFAFRGPMNLALWASYNSALTTTAGSLTASVASAGAVVAGAAINSVNVPPGTTVGVISGTTVTLAPPALTLMATNMNVNSQQVTLPAGANVAALLGATVTVPQPVVEGITLPAGTMVSAIIQNDIAPVPGNPQGTPGIIELSAYPTAAPSDLLQHPLRFALAARSVTVTGADAKAIFTGAGITYAGTVQVERSFDGGYTWVLANIGAGTLAQFGAGTPISLTFGEPERNVLYRLNCTAYSSGQINYRISQTGGAAESLAIGPLSGG